MKIIEHTPIMNSDNSPIPYVISASNAYYSDRPYKALYHFAGYTNDSRPFWYSNNPAINVSNLWKIDFGENNLKCINRISLNGILITGNVCSLKNFKLYGSLDDSIYDELLEVTNHPNSTETRIYDFNNNKKYRYYKIDDITSYYSNGHDYYATSIQNLRLFLRILNKYLIKQNEQYYSIKDNQLTKLGIPTDDTQKEQWFNDYDVEDLKGALLTPDESGNKLLNSLDEQFEVRMMKAK